MLASVLMCPCFDALEADQFVDKDIQVFEEFEQHQLGLGKCALIMLIPMNFNSLYLLHVFNIEYPMFILSLYLGFHNGSTTLLCCNNTFESCSFNTN